MRYRVVIPADQQELNENNEPWIGRSKAVIMEEKKFKNFLTDFLHDTEYIFIEGKKFNVPVRFYVERIE